MGKTPGFQLILRAPLKKLIPEQTDPPEARRYFYERLLQVSIENSYYNSEDKQCADFIIRPTDYSLQLIKSLGLIFKDEGIGFSILYDKFHQDDLFEYLRRQYQEPQWLPVHKPGDSIGMIQQPGIWARLSFILALRNTFFVNFTEMPIDTNPAQENLYYSNQSVKTNQAGQVVLLPNQVIVESDFIEVVPNQFPISTPAPVFAVKVYDISGEEVICQLRSVSELLLKERFPPMLACCPKYQGGLTRDAIYLDFSSLPQDKYFIQIVTSTSPGEYKYSKPFPVLYTAAYPIPLCLIDLLFTKPNKEVDGIFPISKLSTKNPVIEPIDYHLKFAHRKTFWNYYIVPQNSGDLVNLSIYSVGPHKVEFAGPCCVRLSNGAKAYRFLSMQRIPLLQKSDYHFQLRGKTKKMGYEDVLVERLPVAAPQQIFPVETWDACNKLKESLCSGGQPGGCKKLRKQLCGESGAGNNIGRSVELLKRMKADPENSQYREPRDSNQVLYYNYSDIFVYV